MKTQNRIDEVRKVLQKFQDAYTERNLEKLDSFMELFVSSDNAELIGIGASKRGGYEWFEGLEKIREIIQSDWEYWGNVVIDIAGAKISSMEMPPGYLQPAP